MKKTSSALLLVSSILLLSAAQPLAADTEKAVVGPTETSGKGELRIIEGIPFVKLSGSYYEMGTQYGSLLKSRISTLYGVLAQPQKWERLKRNKPLLSSLEGMLQPKYVQFLRGVAVGSGLDYDMVLVGSYDAFSLQGCTSVLTRVPDCSGGTRLLHAKNLDNPLPTGDTQAVVEFRPRGELRYIVTEVTGMGMCDGMNEKGITLSVDGATPGMRTQYPENPFVAFKMSEILSSSTSLAEVDKQLASYTSDVGWILICGSGQETDGVVYDAVYDKLLRNPMESKKDLFVTNTHLNPDLTPPNDLLKCPRYETVEKYLKRKGVHSVDDLIELMGDQGTTYGVNNSSTKHSVIYDPRNQTLYVSFADSYAGWGKWLKYDWPKDQATICREPEGYTGTVQLKKTPVSRVVSIRADLPSTDSSGIRADLDAYISLHSLAAAGAGYVVYHGTKGHSFDIEVVQPVTHECESSARVTYRVLQPLEMACVVQHGPFRTNLMGYDAIYRWLSLNDYQTAGPSQECYVKGPWNENAPRDWVTEIRIPVKKKTRWFDFWPFRAAG
ncbi:MAG TPA: C45 family autoproteolytic acyltransferase/hydrolase [Spirochaetia bacterium]|nr:C45 family autoproteolytic acyltransferase/hydrolase [Spirochaetia bacterium]